jgi:16S rRNA (guanine1207-N2)-methyltransferase
MNHYFDAVPRSEPDEKQITVCVRGISFAFKTDRSVFSRHRLDYGTQALLDTVIRNREVKKGRLLDLGCGYGAVGIIMKRLYPAMEVVLCDINQRALRLARENAILNHARFIDVVESDGLNRVNGSFDLILTNPPIRAGKETVHRFFAQSAERLNPGGQLYVVIQKKQGAPSALKKMRMLFASADVVNRTAGYWVIQARVPCAQD